MCRSFWKEVENYLTKREKKNDICLHLERLRRSFSPSADGTFVTFMNPDAEHDSPFYDPKHFKVSRADSYVLLLCVTLQL